MGNGQNSLANDICKCSPYGLQTMKNNLDDQLTKFAHSTCHLFLCRDLGLVLTQSVPLLEDSVLSPLASSLGFETTSLHLILKKFVALCPKSSESNDNG